MIVGSIPIIGQLFLLVVKVNLQGVRMKYLIRNDIEKKVRMKYLIQKDIDKKVKQVPILSRIQIRFSQNLSGRKLFS